MPSLSRRHAAKLLAAAPIAACAPAPPETVQEADQAMSAVAAPAPPPPPVDPELIDIFSAEFEVDEMWDNVEGTVAPIDAANIRQTRDKVVAQYFPVVAQAANKYFGWASEDAKSMDYHHLVSMPNGSVPGFAAPYEPARMPTFELSAAALERMARANHFEFEHDPALQPGQQRIIFGLRGCEIVRASGEFEPTVNLRETRPNHRNYRCVIGVWDPATALIGTLPASTVPLELHLALFQNWVQAVDKPAGQWNACMIPQGLHRRVVGTMHQDRSLDRQWPHTLRQASLTPVMRSPGGDAFTWEQGVITGADGVPPRQKKTLWDPSSPRARLPNVGAHIHAGVNKSPLLQFSSQGCQTLPGRYNDGVATDAVAKLHQLMGFSSELEIATPPNSSHQIYKTAHDGIMYPFMLLTGMEARLHATGADFNVLRRVRLGSSPPLEAPASHVVRQLKRRLRPDAPDIGRFDGVDMLHLIALQEELSDYPEIKPDGIFAPHQASVVGNVAFGDI